MRRIFFLAVFLVFPAHAFAEVTVHVSKTTTFYSDTPMSSSTIPTSLTTFASAPLPEKYKSKKNALLITVTAQVNCTSDSVYAFVSLAGTPAVGPNNRTACVDSGSRMLTQIWMVPSEAQGGNPISEDTTVNYGLASGSAEASVSAINISVVAVK